MVNADKAAILEQMHKNCKEFAAIRDQPDINYVPGRGACPTNIMIIGEAPGAQENAAREPFVGASGAILNLMLEDFAHIDPDAVWITNPVKYRPPGNRKPTILEELAARDILRVEWAMVGGPRLLVPLGASAWNIVGRPEMGGILANAGQAMMLGNNSILWPMAHPAYALRNVPYRDRYEELWQRFGDYVREEHLL